MDKRIDILKGIHPGKLMERDMKKMGLNQRILAEKTNIPYQTINAILAGRRNLTTSQALKVEHVLDYEEGLLLILQAYHEIKRFYRLTDIELMQYRNQISHELAV